MKVSYWNNNGKYQNLYERVVELIPVEGSCPNPKTANKNLDRLRRAGNCYYDLYNNGLCNRAAEFRRVFGFSGTWIAKSRYPEVPELEAKLDQFILEAAKEQNILVEVPACAEEHY